LPFPGIEKPQTCSQSSQSTTVLFRLQEGLGIPESFSCSSDYLVPASHLLKHWWL